MYNISGGSYGSPGTIGRNLNAGAGFYGSSSPDPTGGPKDLPIQTHLGGAKISGDYLKVVLVVEVVAGERSGGGGGYSGGGGATDTISSPDPVVAVVHIIMVLIKLRVLVELMRLDDHGQVEITFIPEFSIAPTPLYNFTSQIFGNYEALGRNGPTLTQARDELDGAPKMER